MTTRREFMKSTALWGGLPALSTLGLSESLLAEEQAASVTEFKLPSLPYRYEALEPYIDGRTMRIHHGKHHAGYTMGLNKTLKKLEEARNNNDFADIQSLSRALAFHAGGYINHIIFWNNMAPVARGGGGLPSGKLADRITTDFGSFEKFRAQFNAAAAKVEGNGWCVLGYQPMLQRLVVTQVLNHQNLNIIGMVPLLIIDVWEHAYYLKYRNDRGEFIQNWWSVVNWTEVAKRYEATTAMSL